MAPSSRSIAADPPSTVCGQPRAFLRVSDVSTQCPYRARVNGFGLTRQEILQAVTAKQGQGGVIFREVLTNAVAGNVLVGRVINRARLAARRSSSI